MISRLEPPRAYRRPVPTALSVGLGLARIPIRWNHLIDKNTRKLNMLDHVLIRKVGSTFRGHALATFLVASVALSPAQAQYGWRDDFYGAPEPYYPDPGYPGYPDRVAPSGMSLADVRQKVAERGLRLIATPRRKGRIYLAETEDAHGIRHRLVFDAVIGRLIENTILGPKTPLHTQLPTPPQRPDEASKIPTETTKDKLLGDRPPNPSDPDAR